MRLPIVIGTPLLMLLLGVGLEVATFLSNKSNGTQHLSHPILVLNNSSRLQGFSEHRLRCVWARVRSVPCSACPFLKMYITSNLLFQQSPSCQRCEISRTQHLVQELTLQQSHHSHRVHMARAGLDAEMVPGECETNLPS